MKLFPTFSKWFNGLKQFVKNRFDAAYTNWGDRRWLNTVYQDARFEVDYNASMELARKQIYFVQNVPIIKRIENLKVQFAVGVDGLMLVPNASDPKMTKEDLENWNETRAARWEKFALRPDLGSNMTLSELTILWERNLFRTGNILILKTNDGAGNLKIQTIDRLRLQTPPQFMQEEGKTVCQGIRLKQIPVKVNQLDPVTGKIVPTVKTITTTLPESYYIRDEFDLTSFAEVPAENVIHKFVTLQPGQMVGVPEGHAGINLIHDFTDLHILEMGASKLAAKIATVETNASGELDPQFMRQTRLGIGSAQPNGNTTTRQTMMDYQVTLGGEKIALKSGDKLENFMVNRPTVAQQDYWDFLLSQLCVAYNVPKLLVVPYSLQGTVTRADLDICSTAFRADFELVASALREIYVWWSERDLRHNPENYKIRAPKCPHCCVIRPPRKPNVDIGYTAQALATEFELGIKNLQDWCAENNIDWHNHLRQNAEIEAFIDQLAEEYKITPERIAFKLFKSGVPMSGVESDPANSTETEEPEEVNP